ncbi:hypothetical protein NMY22_g1272 [Coprinellus aureogranulatus]|nr:hypothetical protein NMY22_g1272 [Coprinellus aureogranulatus]
MILLCTAKLVVTPKVTKTHHLLKVLSRHPDLKGGAGGLYSSPYTKPLLLNCVLLPLTTFQVPPSRPFLGRHSALSGARGLPPSSAARLSFRLDTAKPQRSLHPSDRILRYAVRGIVVSPLTLGGLVEALLNCSRNEGYAGSLITRPGTGQTAFAIADQDCDVHTWFSLPLEPRHIRDSVRIAIYVQNLLCFFPALWAIWDGKVSDHELESAETQATTNLVLAFAILLSCIVQGITGKLTEYHASIVLSLSWMNNTNVFVYFLLYVQYKGQPGVGAVERRWSAWARHVVSHVVSVFQHSPYPAESEAINRETDSQAEKAARVLFRRITLLLGSLHLSLMAALGIWLWSQPRKFGSTESSACAMEFASFAVLGRRVPLDSKVLRILSLAIYSTVLVPGANLLLPMAIFLSVYFLHHRLLSRSTARLRAIAHQRSRTIANRLQSFVLRPVASRVLPVYIGLSILFVVNAVFIMDIELTLWRNEWLQDGQPDAEWGFGQILSILLHFMPLRDVMETMLAKRRGRLQFQLEMKKQRMNSDFIQAIYRKDVRQIVQLIKKGVDPNLETQVPVCMQSALQVAVPKLHYRTSEPPSSIIGRYRLIQPPTNQWPRFSSFWEERDNQSYGWRYTPSVEDWETVRTLCDAGADPNTVLRHKLADGSPTPFPTVLQAACGVGMFDHGVNRSSEMVKFLLGKDANPGSRIRISDDLFTTPVQAVFKQTPPDIGTIEVLLNAGVHINTQYLVTIYDWPAEQIPGWPIPVPSNRALSVQLRYSWACLTILYLACENNHHDVAQALLDMGNNLDIDAGSDQPLRIACGFDGSIEMVKLLLDGGADPNFQGMYGTPLQTAVSACRPWSRDVVRLLLERGADPNSSAQHRECAWSTSYGHHASVCNREQGGHKKHNPEVIHALSGTPLHLACKAGSPDIVRMLLANGADPNAPGKPMCGRHGCPLYIAVLRTSYEVAELLLRSGADLNIQDGEYGAPLQRLCELRPEPLESIEFLLDKGADPNIFCFNLRGEYGTALQAAAHQGSMPLVRLLLSSGADPNITGGIHGSALHAACDAKSLDIVRLILENGVDPNLCAGEHLTPIHAACAAGDPDIVRILLEHDADPNKEVDEAWQGRHPVLLHAFNYAQGVDDGDPRKRCTEYLLEYGASLRAPNLLDGWAVETTTSI